MKPSSTKRRVLLTAGITALYVVLCLLFNPASYGPMQVRVSEALTLLVVLCPEAILGVTLGCFLSNLISFSPMDLVIGTLSTLLAAMLTYELRDLRIGKTPKNPGFALVPSLPPVIINALFIGAEISFFDGTNFSGILLNILTIGAGQIISCCILGVALVWVIEKTPRLRKLFTG